ncbi:MAG: S8 family serine peptidase [Thermoanaerobaculia bacterium]
MPLSRRFLRLRTIRPVAPFLSLLFSFPAFSPAQAVAPANVDPWVLDAMQRSTRSTRSTRSAPSAPGSAGTSEFLIVMKEQADLSGAARLSTKAEKGRFVVERLRETAARSQSPVLATLAAAGVEHRSYWVANLIWAKGDANLVATLAARSDVRGIAANPVVAGERSRSGQLPDSLLPETFDAIDAVEWNISLVNAPAVWALGYSGQGAVVAGEDTGYDWTHLALKSHYRGWNGATADHNFNWHDAIHSSTGDCSGNHTEPCDDVDHGSHTMGTMVGDDNSGNQIGMAPQAKWIGCRNMDQGNGTPATYTECWQWMIAPTDLANANPDPAKAPDAINNSWGCPAAEGCDANATEAMRLVVESVRAAGIVPVSSAGNSGSGCSSVSTPAAIYDAIFTVGSTTISDSISSFSSRGPVTVDGSNRRKPDIAAPGSNVRSSVPGGGFASFSGTSMASPHVVGLVALLISAEPALAGNVERIEELIREGAVHLTSSAQVCGGLSATVYPNNTFGFGRIDAMASIDLLLAGLLFRDGFESGLTDDWTPTLP